MQLSNVRAVITGGVSGLGFAVAQHLVAAGGKVALFDVNAEKGTAAVTELGADNAQFFKMSDEAYAHWLIDEAVRTGKIAVIDGQVKYLGDGHEQRG